MKLIKRYLAYATNIREFIISFEKTYYWSEFVNRGSQNVSAIIDTSYLRVTFKIISIKVRCD